jgi:hypothetical protein
MVKIRSRGARLLVLAVVVAAVGTAMLAHATGSDHAPTASPSPPPVFEDRLRSSDIDEAPGVDLEPAPDAMQPGISADQGADIAWQQEPPEGGADSMEATFALYGRDGPAVWRIRFEGACIQPAGPPLTAPGAQARPCNTEWNVQIDATTGESMQGYTDR